MICFSIYTSAGSFVQRFETLERAELWRRFMGVTKYTIRKEKW
jgi:hypothetical protein